MTWNRNCLLSASFRDDTDDPYAFFPTFDINKKRIDEEQQPLLQLTSVNWGDNNNSNNEFYNNDAEEEEDASSSYQYNTLETENVDRNGFVSFLFHPADPQGVGYIGRSTRIFNPAWYSLQVVPRVFQTTW